MSSRVHLKNCDGELCLWPRWTHWLASSVTHQWTVLPNMKNRNSNTPVVFMCASARSTSEARAVPVLTVLGWCENDPTAQGGGSQWNQELTTSGQEGWHRAALLLCTNIEEKDSIKTIKKQSSQPATHCSASTSDKCKANLIRWVSHCNSQLYQPTSFKG